MLREKKGNEKSEMASHHHHHRCRGVMGLPPASSSYYHPIPDQLMMGSADTERHLYWRNSNGCVVVDDLGLSGDFQKMVLGDRNGVCAGRTTSGPSLVARNTTPSGYNNNRFFQGLSADASSVGGGLTFHSPSNNNSNNQHCNMDPRNLSCLLQQRGINPPKHGFTVEDAAVYKPRMRLEEPGLFPQSVVVMKTAKKLDLEDTYVLQERSCHSGTPLQFLGDKSLDFEASRIWEDGRSLAKCHAILLHPTFNSMSDVRGNVCLIAKDQHGCRFLQKKFEEGSYQDVELIFDEIIDRIVELMMNPFGNYLIQKLLDVCHEEQRMRIVHMVTREPGQLVRISLNTHGTRVVQKLIETLSTQEQISLVVVALEPGFLDLIKDLNGNHVIQRCLQCLSTEDNKFIFDAAAKFCVDIATHRHGCCVLQRCIDHSNGEKRQKLITEICSNSLLLAQDPFGNYVVQYILEKKIAYASAQLVAQFEDHFVHLSMQKFSSHVVEKCLKFYEESRRLIVHELLSVSHFERVLQDQYANYVIQSALDVTKGPLHESLVAAVRPHTILRTNPYCKKIFSRGLLKK